MAAITWRTLQGASPSEALQPMVAAQRSFDSAFNGLSGVLKQQESTDAANWQQGKTNNTNAYMDQLRSLDTPEKMAEAQRTGLLDQLKQGYGAQVDSQAVGAAQDARMGILQERAIQAGVFQDKNTERVQRPIVDQIKMLNAQGKFDESQALQAQHTELANRAALVSDMNSNQSRVTADGRATTTFNNGQTEFGNKQAMFPGELKKQEADLKASASRLLTDVAQRNSLNASANAANANADQSRAAAAKALRDSAPSKLRDELTKEYLSKSPLSAGTMDSVEGGKLFREELYKITDNQAQRDDIMQNFKKYYGDGIAIGKGSDGKDVRIGLPVAVALEALRSSTDMVGVPNFLGWSRRGDDFDNKIKERLKDPQFMDEIGAAYAIQTNRQQPVFDAAATVADLRRFKPTADPRSSAANFSGTGVSTPKK